jgi:murein DD-endopeptidase MepM/ murein hydrolase activator NlpD
MNITNTLFTIQKIITLCSCVPFSVLAMQIVPLELKNPTQVVTIGQTASILPITGAQLTAKDNAAVIAEYSFADIKRPFYGGNLTTRFSRYHPGIDIAFESGAEMKSILAGTVIESRYDYSGYGNTVVINHHGGLQSRYAHLQKIYVTPGQKVEKDTVIGTLGSTGRSTGPHLHLEVYDQGRPINPLDILP